SFQETVDSKILYAMLILSGLVILGVASIGFETKSPEDGIDGILARFPGAKEIPFTNEKAPLRYEIQDFKQADPQKRLWESDYQFSILVHEQPVPGPEGQDQPVRGTFRFLVYLSILQEAMENPTKENQDARLRVQQLQRYAISGQRDKVKEAIKT